MRHSHRHIILIALSLTVSGCQSAPDQDVSQADREAAEAKLQEMLNAKEIKMRAEEDAVARLREADRQAAEANAIARAEAMKPHYDPNRLQYATRPRTWEYITVPDLNIKAVFNSVLVNGVMQYRVALLGQRPALNTLMARCSKFGVNFADQSGNKIFEFAIPAESFHFAPDGFNGGMPTMETQGSVPLELPIYEQSVQWNLTWNN